MKWDLISLLLTVSVTVWVKFHTYSVQEEKELSRDIIQTTQVENRQENETDSTSGGVGWGGGGGRLRRK